jgi:hypothetical protein
MKRLRLLILSFIVLIASVSIYMHFLSSPIQVTQYTKSNDNKSIVLGIENKGWRDVKLVEVTINGRHIPKSVDLGIGYSSLHVGFDTVDQYVEYVPLDSRGVQPKLSNEKLLEQFEKLGQEKLSDGALLPTNYGVRIVSDIEIDSVSIRYKYLFFSIKRDVYLNETLDNSY